MSLDVEWMAPQQSQCDVTSYTVGYNLTLLDQCVETNKLNWLVTNETSLIVHHLEPYSNYEMTVQARSGRQHGPAEYDSAITDESGV